MRLVFVVLVTSVTLCNAFEGNDVEPRGKKIGLLIYFADLVIKKIFILKIVYAIAFWILLHKAGFFFTWLLQYMKNDKQEHVHHGHEYGPPPGGPYRRKNPGFNPYSTPASYVNPY